MQGLANGVVVHGHKLLEKVGEGRYGEVWRAEYLGQPVALKLFKGVRGAAQLKREVFAQYALGRIAGEDGRWFPRVDHLDLEADPPYLRMEFVEGATLERRLAGELPLDARLALGERILRALAVVHARDFVHGDLSPLNVLVTGQDDVRLIDVGFGALPEDSDIAMSTTVQDAPAGVASPLYSAPERFQVDGGGCGKPADLFSFGKLLYHLVSGEQPFVIKPLSRKHRGLGDGWDAFLFRCLEEKPEARFADASAALAEYRRLYRPALRDGEYRAECPECRAAQSIPGSWTGERFDCRGCGRRLEVLFTDETSRYATTALLSASEAATPPPIQFLDAPAPPPPPVRPVPAPPVSYVGEALVTFIAYFFLWVPGAILNGYFLDAARGEERRTGRRPAGLGALRAMLVLGVYLPLSILGAIALLVLVAAGVTLLFT